MPDGNVVRREYERGTLDRSDLAEDPVAQFRVWFDEAVAELPGEPHAMAVATASGNGVPSVRMLLLKSFDQAGFVFATNYLSRKGMNLEENPFAALLFFWESLERQVRIEGTVEKITPAESDAIFDSRPFGSQVGTITSNQSQRIDSRAQLEDAYRSNMERFSAEVPTRPTNWGGYRLSPTRFEFWQGGIHRLHDRFEYRLAGDLWEISRLQP